VVQPRLWFNEHDYVVALTAADASALIAIHFGEDSPEAIRGDRLGEWHVIADHDAVLLYAIGHHIAPFRCVKSADVMVRPACYWVECFGLGYLASVKE
jgi:hypothetical protein